MGLDNAKEAWDKWEIHCLILLSLSLQVFLFFTADLRRHSASRVLSNVLWLAYLSADTVAVFVLGHLAVHAQGPSHELILFWAPFVLVHLGGQDSITAFSKQDNELWTRHLLSLVTQTAVAGYVVSKSSWPDTRLRASMVLMFLCGFFKYAGRTYCLYTASPESLRASSNSNLWDTLSRHLQLQAHTGDRRLHKELAEGRFRDMFLAESCRLFIKKEALFSTGVDDIMLVDSPVDDCDITLIAEEIPADTMTEFKNMPDRCIAYQYVGASLVRSYHWLYTKASLVTIWDRLYSAMSSCPFEFKMLIFMLTYGLFQCTSTTIALVLFASAQKEGHYSKADITVSYILLVGALVLDLLPTLMSIVSYARKPFRPEAIGECATICFSSCCFQPLGWRTLKQWSEEQAQYSMTRRYSTSVEDYHGSMPSIRKWILKCRPLLGAWYVDFLDLTRTPVTDDLKLFVLDKLIFFQTRRQDWDFANFHGQRALWNWMESNRVVEPGRPRYAALHKSLHSRVEFPTSVLIWHIATEICYFLEDSGLDDTENDETRMVTTERKKRSRELSQYIMYLVFKCDVLLTSNSRLLHYKAHEGLAEILSDQSATANIDEKKAAIKVFHATKEVRQKQRSIPYRQSGGHELQSREQALYAPVLPRAYEVADELIAIGDEARRWHLISEVWLEMLFYTAPRCGPDFHYEHLSTGGEFISHVLLLMRSLGPFMPKPEVPTFLGHNNIRIEYDSHI